MPNVHKKLNASSIAPPSPPWVDLPAEITMGILQRLGTIEILESVQRVCSTWWKLCHDPAMWHIVDLKYEPDFNQMPRVLEKICQIAVDRSQGQLFKISIENFGFKDLLNYIAERSTQLRHLRVVKGFYDFAGGLAAYAKNLPYLEELHMHFTFITKEDIQSVGLEAILDGCPHLVSLDLRCCNIDLEGDLGRRCKQQIVDLKQPHASSHDYEFDSEVWYFLDCWSSA